MDREQRNQYREERRQYWENRRQKYMANSSGHGHVWTGIFILLVGIAALLNTSIPDLPDWIFSWQTFLIALGLFLGFRHGFRGAAWLILIMVGSAFLLRDFYPELSIRRYIWPIALIAAGAFIIIRPRRKLWQQCAMDEKKSSAFTQPTDSGSNTYRNSNFMGDSETWSKEDYVDSTSIFGGDKKNILSKDFKGGDIVNIFGGTELNLTQADIKSPVTIEITTIFGGTKLIVPSNWEVKSEAVSVFGGMEDKRAFTAPAEPTDKVLILKGTVIFGGIEIKSF